MLDAEPALSFAALCLGLLTAGTALWVGLRRQARTIAALADAILGHEEVRDRSGAPIHEAKPGIAARMSSVDRKLDEVAALARRVTRLEEGHASLTGRVSVLEDARVERVVTQAESAAHWRAVEAAHQAPHDPAGDPAGDAPAAD